MDNSMWGFIGVIVVAFGIYSIYAFFKMKFKGEISASLLLGKEYTYKKCKNKEEFIAKTAPAVLGLGVIATVYGVIDVIHCYVYSMQTADTIGMLVFLAALVAFCIYSVKIRDRYFG